MLHEPKGDYPRRPGCTRLVLTRKTGQTIRVRVGGVDVWVRVVEADRGDARLLVEAPASVSVDREEVARRKDGAT